MRGSRGLFARRRCIVPRVTSILIVLLLSALPAATDHNAPAPAAPGRPVSFRVFQNMDKPITGRWQLDIPEGTPRRIELKELVAGEGSALVGVDIASGEELLRLDRKKEGIGYAGEMKKVFAPCGLDPLPVREFLPLGDSIQVRFETAPPEIACPPIDSGKAGRLEAFAAGGSSLRLRDLSELSSAETRDTYSIGGDRSSTQTTFSYRLDAVTLDPGTEVRLRQRMKAPLDGSLWYEVEAVVAPEAGVAPPRGYLRGSSLRFVGSLTMQRIP